jgi:hypothetical protein
MYFGFQKQVSLSGLAGAATEPAQARPCQLAAMHPDLVQPVESNSN